MIWILNIFLFLCFLSVDIPTIALVLTVIPYVFGRLASWDHGNNGNVGSPIPSYLFMFYVYVFPVRKMSGLYWSGRTHKSTLQHQ